MSDATGALLITAFVVASVSAISFLRDRALQVHRPTLMRIAIGLNILSFSALVIALRIGLLPMSGVAFFILVAALLIFMIQNYRSFRDLQKFDTTLGRWRS
jgi:uncharacterized membrane protein YfcA